MIRSLNLDRMFVPTTQTEIEFEMLKFSGGEMHIKLNNNFDYSEIEKVIITSRVKNGDDLMKILISKDALERKGIKSFDLIMPYVPYARQDRQCASGESFTLKVFCDLLNSASFEEVIVYDAHSDVAPALINNCINYTNYQEVCRAIDCIEEKVILISPDSGANKKSNNLFDAINAYHSRGFYSLVKCDKKRDVETGKLSGFEVFADDLKGKSCMIVDDLCDGGRTFIGIAEELKRKNAGNIYLFVSHGIFSKGFDELDKHFKRIFCTNSFQDIDNYKITEYVKQFKIQF